MVDGNTAAELTPEQLAQLGTATGKVFRVMRDGQWRTLWQIQKAVANQGRFYSETCISARLRDLRKTRFGSHTVERQTVSGVFYYRLVVRCE